MNTYQPGNLATLTNTFTDSSGNPADPTLVTLRVTDPTGTETDYTLASATPLVKVSVGVYSLDIVVITAGVWAYRWEGTGSNPSATESRFVVSQSVFSNPQ